MYGCVCYTCVCMGYTCVCMGVCVCVQSPDMISFKNSVLKQVAIVMISLFEKVAQLIN